MPLTKFTDLVELMNTVGVPLRADLDQQVLRGPFQAPPLASELVLRWRDPVLAVSCRVLAIPDDRLRAIETTVCRANNGIALPGFVIDYEAKALCFKLTLLTPEGIEEATIRKSIEATIEYARDFAPAFAKIVEGEPPEALARLVTRSRKS